MRESRYLELKETVNNTFLKTVSAYANYAGGEIRFGVTDSGVTVGIENASAICLDLENKINDSILPQPDYSLTVSEDDVIALTVRPGKYKPYLYKGKAYRRNDTATVEVDRAELDRLVLSGEHLYFDELPSKKQELTFDYLQSKLRELFDVGALSQDVMKTLGLYETNGGYNNAALLLSEENAFPGVDMVKFGPSIDIIEDRETISGCSVLEQYDLAVRQFAKYYLYEQIEGTMRVEKARVPERAFREALANALVHRDWNVRSAVRVAMYPDRIEVISPGGLPQDVSTEEYRSGHVSVLRNPTLGMLFFRLHLIEMFGTGVRRIKAAYGDSLRKPDFDVFDNSISVTLPVVDMTDPISDAEQAVLAVMRPNASYATADLIRLTGFNRAKVLRVLKKLLEKKLISVAGNGRGTKYSRL